MLYYLTGTDALIHTQSFTCSQLPLAKTNTSHLTIRAQSTLWLESQTTLTVL